MSEPKPGAVVVVSGADELKKLLGTSPPPSAVPAVERASTTEHTVTVDGVEIRYRAVAGTMIVGLEDREKPKGKLFYVAYTRTDVEDSERRPITFCFNGGPGSSAVWLHMGCLGPRRVRLDVGQVPRPGAMAEDNPMSLLDTTDLVFVDPMSTGYSLPDDGKGGDYHGVTSDVESVAEFIRKYTTRNNRWSSPKYLAGESYGTTRAASLAKHLQDRHGMYLDGLVLVSVALKFQTLMFHDGNDLPYVLYVAGYAATAAYHGKVHAEDLGRLLTDAETWAYDRYAPALLRGTSLSEAEQDSIARELSAFIGVSPEFIRRCNLRVELGRFCRELLRDRRTTVGRLDSRFTGQAADAAGERLEVDPSMSALYGAYTSAFHRDLRARLNYEEDELYEVLNLKANQAWKWDQDNRYLDVTGDLRQVLLDNQHLRVLVASGIYDLATPVTATDYTLNQLGLEPERRGAVIHHKYRAGHMMYVHEPSLVALRRDLLAFYTGR